MNVGQGQPALAGASQQDAKALEIVYSRFKNLHSQFAGVCGRLDSALDRVAPSPKNAENASKAPQPMGYINQLEALASDFEATLKWLEGITDRLDRIA